MLQENGPPLTDMQAEIICQQTVLQGNNFSCIELVYSLPGMQKLKRSNSLHRLVYIVVCLQEMVKPTTLMKN
jgi:hypothetical protein